MLWYVIKQNFPKILIFMICILIFLFIFYWSMIYGYTKYIETQSKHNIKIHKEIIVNHLCSITNCNYIKYQGVIYNNKEVPHTKESIINKSCSSTHPHMHNEIISTDVDFGKYYIKDMILNKDLIPVIKIEHETGDVLILLNVDNINRYLTISYVILLIILTLLFISFLYITLKEEKNLSMRSMAVNEAILTNKSFIMITENIHHELNTPLEVIENKIEKIYNIIMDYQHMAQFEKPARANVIDAFNTLNLEFEYVRNATSMIYAVNAKTSNFKQMRYSNGNKTIYDIIKASFDIASISNTNFTYCIDESLKNYKLHKKLANVYVNFDLVNNILNFIKNSLEASSTKIHILFNRFENNIIYFSIIDNGNGIPKEAQRKIFEADFSTKATGDIIRGNGLYIIKSILTSPKVKGDVKLVNTSSYGTTFQLCIPSYKLVK